MTLRKPTVKALLEAKRPSWWSLTGRFQCCQCIQSWRNRDLQSASTPVWRDHRRHAHSVTAQRRLGSDAGEVEGVRTSSDDASNVGAVT